MKAIVQRTDTASVTVAGEVIANIRNGLTVLLGVGKDDTEKDALFLAEKIIHLRIFPDEQGKMNLSLRDVGGELLIVSQFTLYGDCRKGRRPSFDAAASPDKAEELYEVFVSLCNAGGIKTATGRFQTEMIVHMANHGPVTLILDSKHTF